MPVAASSKGRSSAVSATSSLAGTHVVGFDGKHHDFYMRQLWDGKGSFDCRGV